MREETGFKAKDKIATFTGTDIFGLDQSGVAKSFVEKPAAKGLIGFYVFNNEVFGYLDDNSN